jgi:hypothetical protein
MKRSKSSAKRFRCCSPSDRKGCGRQKLHPQHLTIAQLGFVFGSLDSHLPLMMDGFISLFQLVDRLHGDVHFGRLKHFE